MQWFVGTSGFSYKPWKGVFYPDKLPDREMLRYYATQLNAVELNNTFYRMPRAEQLARWRDQVTEGFRFAVKAPRRITHQRRLRDAKDEVGFFARALEALGEQLGCVLFQLPPTARVEAEVVQQFLELWPAEYPAAFEFRHRSGSDPSVQEVLARYGAALCLADTDDAPTPDPVCTGDWGYVRLRRASYPEAALQGWIETLGAQPWKRVFVFFKHEEEGRGPHMAQELMTLLA